MKAIQHHSIKQFILYFELFITLKRVIFFLSHPIQYQSPLFQLIAKEKDIDFSVCYFTDHTIGGIDQQFGERIKWDVPLLEGYKYKFLKNYSLKPAVSGKFWGLVNFGVFNYLLKEKPDSIVVHGWAYFSNLLLLLSAKILQINVIMRAESPMKQEKMNLLKKIILKYFVNSALYLGTQNKKFYLAYGMHDSKLFKAPYCVDNSRFGEYYKKIFPFKEAHKRQFGLLKSDITILFSGKYIEKKRPMDLLRAFKMIDRKDTKLIMVGEGEKRAEMEQFIIDHRLSEKVKLTGFVNQTEISKYYGIADIIVLPSGRGETWGLVLNEAMNFHLPLIVSDMVGSSDDLVIEGENGFNYPCGDVKTLSEKIKILVGDVSLRKTMGGKSAEIVKEFSYKKIIEGLKKAIN